MKDFLKTEILFTFSLVGHKANVYINIFRVSFQLTVTLHKLRITTQFTF